MKVDLYNIDRRIIYLLILIALAVPLISRYAVKPARMEAAEKMFKIIDETKLEPGDVVLVALDFGPNSKAENEPQAEVVIEHLMRKRIPFATFSQYILAQTYLDGIPERVARRLMDENAGERWVYGKDWVNLGLRLNAVITIKAIAEGENIAEYLKKDARGNNLSDVPAFSKVRTLKNIKLFAQFTSLTGTFESYVQFLKSETFRPVFLHGCTSITIPKAYIYLDSGQLTGLLEGVAGAAWYSVLLKDQYPKRAKDASLLINTGLGVAHLVIIALIALGNIMSLVSMRRGEA
jgi:hypothetical protein